MPLPTAVFALRCVDVFVERGHPLDAAMRLTAMLATATAWGRRCESLNEVIPAYDGVDPGGDVDPHVLRQVQVRWAQRALGIDPDGVWGGTSRTACVHFQTRNALPETGELDARTWARLVG